MSRFLEYLSEEDKLGEYNIEKIQKSLSTFIKDLNQSSSNIKKGNYLDAFKKMNSTRKELDTIIKFIKKRLGV